MADRYTFRGKRMDGDHEWVQGSLISFANGGEAILPSETQVFVPQGQTIIASKYCCHVAPSTVGQCTGITDKNGKLIWEGDIVELPSGDTGKITWEDTDAKFAILYDGYVQADFDEFWGDELGVIGNAHDNPELLGG